MMRTTQIFFLLGVLLPLCAVVTSHVIKSPQNAFQKPGQCPPERNYKRETTIIHNLCKNDTVCPNNMKCCRDNGDMMCKPPAQEKPGQCPTYNPSLKSAKCDDNCTADSECPGSKKCCTKFCGKTCVDTLSDLGKPSTETAARKGFCKQEALYKCLLHERCFCDENSCIDGYKCCPDICKVQCLPAIPERNGVCPTNADCPSPDTNSCSTDHNCSAFHKCCSTSCGQRCLRAINVTLSIHG